MKFIPVFQDYLGADFDLLSPKVREAHDVQRTVHWVGRAQVSRGTSLWSRVLAAAFGFPPATDDTAVTVMMTPRNGGELWERRFGSRQFRSFLKVQNGLMTERFGPFTFTLGLHVLQGQLHFPVQSGRVGCIPFPNALLPVSIAHEYEANGRFHFDVALMAPLTGALMVHYQGWLIKSADLS